MKMTLSRSIYCFSHTHTHHICMFTPLEMEGIWSCHCGLTKENECQSSKVPLEHRCSDPSCRFLLNPPPFTSWNNTEEMDLRIRQIAVQIQLLGLPGQCPWARCLPCWAPVENWAKENTRMGLWEGLNAIMHKRHTAECSLNVSHCYVIM